ncbi:MAG: AEC family transporter [Rhodospirillales bacterium]
MTASGHLALMADLFAIIAPVFAGAGLGWLWGRLKRPFDHQMVTALSVQLATPYLVFATLTRMDVTTAAFGEIALAALLSYALMGALGAAALLSLQQPFHSYLPSLVFGNIGNMGLPLCLFAYGHAGLALAIAVFAVGAVLQFTIGVWIAAGKGSALELLRTPILYSVAAALAFMLAGVKPPLWLHNSTRLIGDLMIPLMLLALGVSLASLRVASMARAVGFSVLRLVGGFACGVAVAWAMGLTGPARGVLVVQSTMPVAVFNYLFAKAYDRKPEEVAGIVLISTLISFATLPLLLLAVL